MSSKNNVTSLKTKSELNQEELVVVRNAIEKTLEDYYQKKSSIFYNAESKNI